MYQKRIKAFLIISICVLSIAACGSQEPGIPVTGQTADLPPKAVLDAQRWLADQLNVGIEQVQIVEMEQSEWTDSCLGLGRLNESCLAVMTPGWRVMLAIDGQTYEVRTDETGQTIRMMDPQGDQTMEEGLEDVQWNLVSLGPRSAQEPLAGGSSITLTLEGGQAGGSGGCNAYGTTYQAEGNSIEFETVTSTLRACTDAQISVQEQTYFEALSTAASFELLGNQLLITYNNGAGLLTFESAGPAAPLPTLETPAN